MHWVVISASCRAVLAGAGGLIIEAFSAFVRAAAPAAITALWQGIVIAATLYCGIRLAPRISAGYRFLMWTVGFVLVACLPFLPLLLRALTVSTTPLSHSSVVAAQVWLRFDSRWAWGIAGLWFVAAAVRATSLAFHIHRLHGLWKSARPVESSANIQIVLAGNSPSRRPIELYTTSELDRPGVIGFFAPRILIPEWLYDQMTPQELEQVILHEAEHLHRRDDWTNLVQKMVLVLFPLNPTLVWIEHCLCGERELACDEGVVRRTKAPRRYAACLTSLAERGIEHRALLRRAHALSLGVFVRRSELVRRVSSLLLERQKLHPVAARAIVGVMGCGLLFGSMQLARTPQLVVFVSAPTQDVQIATLAPFQPSSIAADGHSAPGSAKGRIRSARMVVHPERGTIAISILPRTNTRNADEEGDRVINPDEMNAGVQTELVVQRMPLREQQSVIVCAWQSTQMPNQERSDIPDDSVHPSIARHSSVAAWRIAVESALLSSPSREAFSVEPDAAGMQLPSSNHQSQQAPVSNHKQPVPLEIDLNWLVFEL